MKTDQESPSTHDTEALAIAQSAFQAARCGDAASLARLLDLGLPPDVRNEKGDSLLMLAAYHGHAAATALLLERGADPELANDRGQVPLAGAAFKGDVGIVRLLLDGGATVDGAGLIGRAPLLFATMFGRGEVAALLRERGAVAGDLAGGLPGRGAPWPDADRLRSAAPFGRWQG